MKCKEKLKSEFKLFGSSEKLPLTDYVYNNNINYIKNMGIFRLCDN